MTAEEIESVKAWFLSEYGVRIYWAQEQWNFGWVRGRPGIVSYSLGGRLVMRFEGSR